MPSQHKVGIVTVTYNSAEVLPDFFRSLWSQTHTDFILYAIDNASKDTSVAALEAETDRRLRIVASKDNVGVAEGNNIGIRMALADGCSHVLLLNNDVVFPPDLIGTLLASLDTNRCDMVSPKMMYFEPSDRIWWAGGHFQRILGFRSVHRRLNEPDKGQYQSPEPATYAPTCCLLVKTSVFSTIGLMDPKYFVYWDDTDFMLRAYKAQIPLFYEPGTTLFHKVSSLTQGSSSPFMIRLLSRNRVYFWLKNMGRPLGLGYALSLSLVYVLQAACRLKTRTVVSLQLRGMIDGLKIAQ